jgi:hypothetical protein
MRERGDAVGQKNEWFSDEKWAALWMKIADGSDSDESQIESGTHDVAPRNRGTVDRREGQF